MTTTAAALDALRFWFRGRAPVLPNPPDDLLVEMMSISLGDEVQRDYAPLIRRDLELPPPSESPAASTDHQSPPEGHRAAIIGAGISGLCAAIQLQKAGVPYVILKRRHDVGGVWFDNRYPAAACF